MDNINVNKKDWIKTIRRLYSAVNELVGILGKDVSERGYDKNTLEKKIQAYVNYFDDTKKLIKWENGDRDSLIIKVEDDVSDIVSLSSSKEDARNARKALRELSDVASLDLMDVLKSCIDDGWKVGKYTRYAKKKLIMNNVPSIYEKEETNNWTELYYNVVHWKYQILHWDKIYTTKRETTEKMQEIDSQENWEIEKTVDVTTEQMEETTGINPIKLEDVEKESSDIESVEKAVDQLKKIDTKEENEKLEDGVEWSEEKIIDELKKIQNIDWYQELKRCNDVEFSFLAKQLLKSSEPIDLLKKIYKSGNSEWNMEEVNLGFKNILDKLLANFAVNTEYFGEWIEKLGIKMRGGVFKSFELIKSDLSTELWIDEIILDNLKTISEYMAFICCINNIKNSVINVNKKIKWVWNWSLQSLLNKCEKKCKDNKINDEPEIRLEMYETVNKYLGLLLSDEIREFEKLRKEIKERSDKMEELGNKIESDFELLVLKDGKGEFLYEEWNCKLSKSVQKKVSDLILDYRKNGELNIDDVMYLFLPVFIKMWMFSKNNDIYPHNWLNLVDINNFTCEEKEAWWNITYPVIKYVINWETIELNISKLKDFEFKSNPLTHYYYNFKNVVLYAICKTIGEYDNCPYDFDYKDDGGKPWLVVLDKSSYGDQFCEDSHCSKVLYRIFDEGLEGDNKDNMQFSSLVAQKKDKTVGGGEVSWIQKNGERIIENIEPSLEDSTKLVEEENPEGKWKNDKVKAEEKVEGKQKPEKKGENKAIERKESTENITIEDIIDFYVNNNDERKKLKNLGENGKKEQRKNYKVKIKNKKWIGLWEIEKIVFGKSSSKPYIDKYFDKILAKLKRLISER